MVLVVYDFVGFEVGVLRQYMSKWCGWCGWCGEKIYIMISVICRLFMALWNSWHMDCIGKGQAKTLTEGRGKMKQINVYKNGDYQYQTDDDASNRPWFGKTWAPEHKKDGEIAAALVWDCPEGGTSRWAIRDA